MFFSKWNNNNTIFSIRVTENIFYSPSGKVVWLIWANQRADRVSNAATFVETWGGMVIRRKPSRHWAQSPPHIWGAVYSDGLIPIKYEQVTHDGQWIHLPSDQVFPVFPGRGSWLMYGTFPVLRLQRFECSRGARIRGSVNYHDCWRIYVFWVYWKLTVSTEIQLFGLVQWVACWYDNLHSQQTRRSNRKSCRFSSSKSNTANETLSDSICTTDQSVDPVVMSIKMGCHRGRHDDLLGQSPVFSVFQVCLPQRELLWRIKFPLECWEDVKRSVSGKSNWNIKHVLEVAWKSPDWLRHQQ